MRFHGGAGNHLPCRRRLGRLAWNFSGIGIAFPLPAIHRQTSSKRYEPQPMAGFCNTDTRSDSPVVGTSDAGIRDIHLRSGDDVDPSVLSRKPVCRPRKYKRCSPKSAPGNIRRRGAFCRVHAPLDCDLSGRVDLLALGKGAWRGQGSRIRCGPGCYRYVYD